MNHRALAFAAMLLTLFAIACKGADSPAVGTWKLVLSEDAKKQMPSGMKEPTVTVNVTGDGKFDAKMDIGTEQSTASGTWKLDGKSLSFTTDMEGGKKKDPPKTETVTLSDDMKSFEIPDAAGMGKMVKQ
jgi:hypothetical protein